MDSGSFVAFLRMEADLSEEKARRLRAQADAMAEEHGVTAGMEAAFELNPSEMAPLDENGVPKYKGRKRGRKPKKRKRQLNPNRRKRQHTAYTLFVQENYPGVRAQYPALQSKDIIAMVARQWATVRDVDKAVWKQRAIETHEAEVAEGEVVEEQHEELELGEDDNGEEDEEHYIEVAAAAVAAQGDEADDEGETKDDEEEETPRRRRGRPRKIK